MNEEKSNFEPHEKGEHLNFNLDLTKGEFSIPQGKIDHPLNLISLLLDNVSPSYHVSCITGTLLSMEHILGPVACLHTPALYAVLKSTYSLCYKVALTCNAVENFIFGEIVSSVCAANQSGGLP